MPASQTYQEAGASSGPSATVPFGEAQALEQVRQAGAQAGAALGAPPGAPGAAPATPPAGSAPPPPTAQPAPGAGAGLAALQQPQGPRPSPFSPMQVGAKPDPWRQRLAAWAAHPRASRELQYIARLATMDGIQPPQ